MAHKAMEHPAMQNQMHVILNEYKWFKQCHPYNFVEYKNIYHPQLSKH